MIRTPQYRLPFFQQGEFYYTPYDQERSNITDTQLEALSSLIGDGVLDGWNVSLIGGSVVVSPGQGFISEIVTKTLSFKSQLLPASPSAYVYMQSTMLTPPPGAAGGLDLGTESPASDIKSATYQDLTPPSPPDDFIATLDPNNYHNIVLTWTRNTDLDFSHYEIQRGSTHVLNFTPTSGTFAPGEIFVADNGKKGFITLVASGLQYTILGNQFAIGDTISGITSGATGTVSSTPTASLGTSWKTIASPVNITYDPPAPQTYTDSGLVANTQYKYQISAVDYSGNTSAFSPASATTIADPSLPTEASGLVLRPGNVMASIYWTQSPDYGITYRLTIQPLNPDGTVISTTVYDDLTVTFIQLTGLVNATAHRVTLQTKRGLVLSNGIISEMTPVSSPAPLDVIDPMTATSMPYAVELDWTANASVTQGVGVGQRYEYRIRVIDNGIESSPIRNIGLATTKTITSYQVASGATVMLADGTSYIFRITTLDAFGNESPGAFVKGSTLDTTPPNDPRNLTLVPGDTTVQAAWDHSSSTDVVGYVLNIDTGAGFGGDINIPYLKTYLFTGLTSGVLVKVRIRARDLSGNTSSPGVFDTTKVPWPDTTPPAIPSGLTAKAGDCLAKVSWVPNSEVDISHYFVKRMAVTQSLAVQPGLPLTEAIVLARPIDVGNLKTVTSGAIVSSDDMIGKNYTGDYLYMTSGLARGQMKQIMSMNPANGEMVLVSSFVTYPSAGDNFSIKVTHPSLGTAIRNVGMATSIFDPGLVNNQVYAYYVQAVDTSGNASSYGPYALVMPIQAVEPLAAPTSFTATDGTNIQLAWNYPIVGSPHTGFNIYRSTSQYSGFQLIGSTDPTTYAYTDPQPFAQKTLVDGVKYWYYVTAVKDNAQVVVDPTGVQPVNSILLAEISGTSLTHVQRISTMLTSTIEEETSRRILSHKHSLAPVNSTTVTAIAVLAGLDASTLTTAALLSPPLSPDALVYYNGLLVDKNLKKITYSTRTTYVFDPASMVWNVPSVNDFRILVNGAVPTVNFHVDAINNAIVFDSALDDGAVVAFDGSGTSYYIPSRMNLDFNGFNVLVDGLPAEPLVDADLQTLRFLSRLQTTQVITAAIEPTVPDFGTADKSQQVNLSPNTVLNDFTTQNLTLYISASGAFGINDIVYVLVNGARTRLDCTVDAVAKTITFVTPLVATDTVALQVLNVPETDPLFQLPVSRIGNNGIDASQFSTGQFLNAQLPIISHEGRVKERAYPIFQTLSTTNKYSYTATNTAGTGTTPYAVLGLPSGGLLLGTSSGLMKSTGFAAFNTEGGQATITVDYSTKPPGSLAFTTPDDIVTALQVAVKHSGIFNGSLLLPLSVGNASISCPTLIGMDDGNILIVGGTYYDSFYGINFETKDTFIYNPATKLASKTGSLNYGRSAHAGTLLPNGQVMICGGSYSTIMHFDASGNPDWTTTTGMSSTEFYDPILGTWSVGASMLDNRAYQSLLVLDSDTVLAAGGNDGFSDFDARYNPPHETAPTPLSSSEAYSIIATGWTARTSMNRTRVNATSSVDHGVAIVDGGGQGGRELYSLTSDTWTMELGMTQAQQNSFTNEFGLASMDSPVKQFFLDSTGLLLVVTQAKVYASQDQGETFVAMKGLESVGSVHAVSQSLNGTLFAATDLGVYEITLDIHDSLTWFQGGLLGAGTTETFDLQPVGSNMLAATEIGIFSTVDDGNTWLQLATFEDVYNIALVGSVLFANSDKDLYESLDDGITWSKKATLPFLDPDSKMIGRTPIDLFFATGNGLWASRDGINFFLVDLDRNRNPARNNVSMCTLYGTDILAGYDNEVYSVGPNLEILSLAQFVGIVPTVRVNGTEARNGFRYDTVHSLIMFERKRLVLDNVEATANYALFAMEGGGWYAQNPNAAISIFVNGKPQDSTVVSTDAMLGQASFSTALDKSDVVTATIVGTSLDNEGEYFHSELEDNLEMQKGLPLSLGRDHAGNILQMVLGVEHNFLERGLDRNQYYCASGIEVDRSFTSFLSNAECYIMGRKEFDRFNSTIDYLLESQQSSIGEMAFVPLCTLQVLPKLWVGTDNGVYVLDPIAAIPFSVSSTKQIGGEGNAIRDLQYFQNNIYAVTGNGLWISSDGGTVFSKNAGIGLPDKLTAMSSLGGIIILSTNDGIYYSDSADPSGTWYKASFVAKDGTTAIAVTGTCTAITASDGTVYGAVDNAIYWSIDGKSWTLGYAFADADIRITDLIVFSKKLFIGTDTGLWNDNSSLKTSSPVLRLEAAGNVPATFHVNDLEVGGDGTTTWLYAVGDEPNVYRKNSEIWDTPVQTISSIKAIHRFAIFNTNEVAISNNLVFVQ